MKLIHKKRDYILSSNWIPTNKKALIQYSRIVSWTLATAPAVSPRIWPAQSFVVAVQAVVETFIAIPKKMLSFTFASRLRETRTLGIEETGRFKELEIQQTHWDREKALFHENEKRTKLNKWELNVKSFAPLVNEQKSVTEGEKKTKRNETKPREQNKAMNFIPASNSTTKTKTREPEVVFFSSSLREVLPEKFIFPKLSKRADRQYETMVIQLISLILNFIHWRTPHSSFQENHALHWTLIFTG